MARWSKLQKQLYQLLDPGIRIQVQCRIVRMNSRCGSTDLPRYWITLGKETIWDYPGQFPAPDGRAGAGYPHVTDISAISELIREYIDTPVAALMSRPFDGDHWGLVNILRAADRRIGARQWPALKNQLDDAMALKVLKARQRRVSPADGMDRMHSSGKVTGVDTVAGRGG
jgi:hypothetical protein